MSVNCKRCGTAYATDILFVAGHCPSCVEAIKKERDEKSSAKATGSAPPIALPVKAPPTASGSNALPQFFNPGIGWMLLIISVILDVVGVFVYAGAWRYDSSAAFGQESYFVPENVGVAIWLWRTSSVFLFAGILRVCLHPLMRQNDYMIELASKRR